MTLVGQHEVRAGQVGLSWADFGIIIRRLVIGTRRVAVAVCCLLAPARYPAMLTLVGKSHCVLAGIVVGKP